MEVNPSARQFIGFSLVNRPTSESERNAADRERKIALPAYPLWIASGLLGAAPVHRSLRLTRSADAMRTIVKLPNFQTETLPEDHGATRRVPAAGRRAEQAAVVLRARRRPLAAELRDDTVRLMRQETALIK